MSVRLRSESIEKLAQRDPKESGKDIAERGVEEVVVMRVQMRERRGSEERGRRERGESEREERIENIVRKIVIVGSEESESEGTSLVGVHLGKRVSADIETEIAVMIVREIEIEIGVTLREERGEKGERERREDLHEREIVMRMLMIEEDEDEKLAVAVEKMKTQ
jgi:hypothetical protein